MEKSRDTDCADEKTPLLDLEKGTDRQDIQSDYAPLDLRNVEISTNFDEKKFIGLKERLDTCKDRATKLRNPSVTRHN